MRLVYTCVYTTLSILDRRASLSPSLHIAVRVDPLLTLNPTPTPTPTLAGDAGDPHRCQRARAPARADAPFADIVPPPLPRVAAASSLLGRVGLAEDLIDITLFFGSNLPSLSKLFQSFLSLFAIEG